MDKLNINKVKKLLPQIPDINGREEYFTSSILVLLAYLNKKYQFIFEKRKISIRQGGEICFPGGKYDKNMDNEYLDTAIRETEEEIGIKRDKIEILGKLNHLVSPVGAIIEAYPAIAKIKSINELRPCENEVEEIFSVPVSFFLNTPPKTYSVQVYAKPYYIDDNGYKIETLPVDFLGLPEIYKEPWGGQVYKVYFYKLERGYIWGITARFIYDFVENYLSKI